MIPRGHSERGDYRRRERSPEPKRGGSRGRERGEDEFARRGSERGDYRRRERSPGLTRGGGGGGGRSRGQDDFARGFSEREGSRRQRSPGAKDGGSKERSRGEDEFQRGRPERGDSRRVRSPGAKRGSIERERRRDRNFDVDSPQGQILRRTLSPSPDYVYYSEEDDVKETKDEERRHDSYSSLRETRDTNERVGREQKSGDEDSDGWGSEGNGEQKVKGIREAAAKDLVNANSESDDVDSQEDRRRGDKKLERPSSSSGEKSEEHDEDTDDDRARKKKSRKDSEELDEDTDDDRARKEKVRKREKHSERNGKKRKHRRKKADSKRDDTSESDRASSSSREVSDSEDEVQREKARKKRKKRRRKEKEKEKEKELEREMRRKLKKKKKEMKEKKLRAELKKKKKEIRSKQPITTSWGKYGILKDIDMWNKRPEFNAWLAEVKKVNTETLTNWEEKLMFKEYMEDYNTATFPSKKYYNLDIYHRRKAMKERMKGMAKLVKVERTDFNDEDERRVELLKEREHQKEAEVAALMRKMQSGMAQDMKEQAQLREEMQYQFRLGNTEAAQAIQRRLDPDAEKFTK